LADSPQRKTPVPRILPKNTARTVAHRFSGLDSRLAFDLYEHEPMLNVVERIDPKGAGNVDTWLVPARESESLLKRARQALGSIIATEANSISLQRCAWAGGSWRRGLRVGMRQSRARPLLIRVQGFPEFTREKKAPGRFSEIA
jgi:hypothetical protein